MKLKENETYIFITINNDEESSNYSINENERDINDDLLTIEAHGEQIFSNSRYIQQIKVYVFSNDKMKLKKTMFRHSQA